MIGVREGIAIMLWPQLKSQEEPNRTLLVTMIFDFTLASPVRAAPCGIGARP
jgi:hypothetical protein